MGLFNSKPNESRRFAKLVGAICKELQIDKKTALSFINADLEKISKTAFPIQNIRLSEIEVEIQRRVKSEAELELEIKKKNELLQAGQDRIANLRSSIDKRTRLITEQEETIAKFQEKSDLLKAEVKKNEKKKNLLSYDVMMKRHSVKEKDDRTFRNFKLFLSLITILAVILAVFFMLKK